MWLWLFESAVKTPKTGTCSIISFFCHPWLASRFLGYTGEQAGQTSPPQHVLLVQVNFLGYHFSSQVLLPSVLFPFLTSNLSSRQSGKLEWATCWLRSRLNCFRGLQFLSPYLQSAPWLSAQSYACLLRNKCHYGQCSILPGKCGQSGFYEIAR